MLTAFDWDGGLFLFSDASVGNLNVEGTFMFFFSVKQSVFEF